MAASVLKSLRLVHDRLGGYDKEITKKLTIKLTIVVHRFLGAKQTRYKQIINFQNLKFIESARKSS